MEGSSYFEARQGEATLRVFVDEKRLIAVQVASDWDRVGDSVGRSAARKVGGVFGSLIFEAFFAGKTDKKRERRAAEIHATSLADLAADPDNVQIPFWAITGAKLEKAGGAVARLKLERKRGDALTLLLPTLRDYYACRALLEKPLTGRLQIDGALPQVARAT